MRIRWRPGPAARAAHGAVLRTHAGTLALALAACGPRGAHVPHGEFVDVSRAAGAVVTPLDFLAEGERRVAEGLSAWAAEEPAADGLLARCEPLCVRVQVRHDVTSTGFRGGLGSGVLLGPRGPVLTAAHVLDGPPGAELWVLLADGGSVRAALAAIGRGPDEDWALLELEGSAGAPATLERALPERGERLLLLGYPDGTAGRDARGRLVQGARPEGARLAPLATLVRVLDGAPLALVPEAGFMPPSGMSGGPAFDARGRLVTVLSGVWTYTDGGGVTYGIDGTRMDRLERRLEER